MNRCNKNLACQEKCSCVKKVKRKRTKTKPKIKAPILPNMTISNASQFPLQAQNLAQNIAHFLRPQISGIMQNTRPRTLMEDKRIQTIFQTGDMETQTTQDTVDMGTQFRPRMYEMGTQSKPSTIDTSSQIRPRMYEMGTQPERPILSVGRLEPIDLLPREPIRETLIPEVRDFGTQTAGPGARVRAGRPSLNESRLTTSREEESEEEIIFFP